jgi:hypothetical protein
MEMPKPTDAHRSLHALAGTWLGEEVMAPSPWDPKGSTVEGWVHNHVELDGFVVVQDYEQRREGAVTFRGHAVMGWDAAAGEHVMHWWDSMGMAPNVFHGKWEDGALVMTHRGERGSSRSVMRVTDGTYRFQMDVSPDGEQWTTWMTGTYRREA